MNIKKELSVNAIKEGTVIDHIPADSLFQVLKMLNLDKSKNQITFGTNLESKRHGLKGIIKVSNRFFEEDEVNKIALVAPNAILNVIRDYRVVEKKEVEIPEEIIGLVKCFNPKCITNNEKITTHFYLNNKEDIALRCHYCEKVTTKEYIEMI